MEQKMQQNANEKKKIYEKMRSQTQLEFIETGSQMNSTRGLNDLSNYNTGALNQQNYVGNNAQSFQVLPPSYDP